MDEKIAQFTSLTGVAPEQAKFFLESSGGDVQAAVATFFESGGAEGATDPTSQAESLSSSAHESTEAPVSGPRTLGGQAAPAAPAGWGSQPAAGASAQRAGAGFSAGGGRGGGITTLRDLASEEPSRGGRFGGGDSDDDDDEDDRRDPENLFTGGERSGLSVQNPNFGRRGQPDIVKRLLQQARDGSANFPGDEPPALGGTGGMPGAASSSFTGHGRSLGDESTPAEPTAPSAAAAAGSSRPLPGAFGRNLGDDEDDDDTDVDEVARRRLTFWQDGFSIEDGPLHRYDDPQAMLVLESIQRGTAPLSLLGIKFGQRVEMQVEERRHEKYAPPPPGPMKAFSGSGNRLGSPAPLAGGSGSQPSTSSSSTAAPSKPSNFQVDDSKPVTQVQIRLGDGSRLVGRFNHDHTVADLRSYIHASQAGSSAQSFTLQSSFPPKPLSDETQTLKDAGLINSVVIQKFA